MGVFAPSVEINLDALEANLAEIKQQSPYAKVMAVIKANAYGHGALKYQHLKADCFAVARISEALQLRDAYPDKDFVVLQGFQNADELKLAEQYRLELVVHHQFQIDLLAAFSSPLPLRVWIKLDSGMHRLGFTPDEMPDAFRRLQQCSCVQQPIPVMSHFACADEARSPHARAQIKTLVAMLPDDMGDLAFANSGAFLNFPQTHADYIRAGLLLYGVSPLPEGRPRDFAFRPVMTLKSKLIAVRAHAKGESVGYGATWIATHDTLLGVISIGYADGYPRHVPSGTPVMVNGRCVPIVGRVSMDMISVDLGPDATEKVGDDAILWGEQLPIEEIALAANTIPYELMTKITPRVVKLIKSDHN